MQLITTSDGSHTIFLPEMNEQYHSVNGAITESEYVYIEQGYNFFAGQLVSVFEVGFGTGLNCLLTALAAEKTKKFTHFVSIEKFPLSTEITNQLNYGQMLHATELFEKIHACQWNLEVQLTPFFTLKKLAADLTNFDFAESDSFDVIYFDAFGPDKQSDMWTQAIFNNISGITSQGGALVTYSAKGDVRRGFAAAGFNMERLPGPPGKKQMLRGIKKYTNI